MVKRFISLALLLVVAPACLTQQLQAAPSKVCNAEQCSLANKNNCLCYCSVKCGPRKIGSVAGDNPQYTYAKGDTQQKYGKRCFCQQRDIDLYIPNQCYLPQK